MDVTSILLIGIICTIVVRLAFEQYNDQNLVLRNYFQSSEFCVLVGVLIFGFIIPIMSHNVFPSLTYETPKIVQYIGIFVMILAIIVFWRAHADLGRHYSPTLQIKTNHELVTNGIYQYVRHPMYTSAFVLILSSILIKPNMVGISSSFMAVLILLLVRIPAEEQMLLTEFSSKYVNYMKETCGVIPFVCNVFR